MYMFVLYAWMKGETERGNGREGKLDGKEKEKRN